MTIRFTKNEIIGESIILYADFEKEDGYKKLIELLQICVTNESNLQFVCDDDCSPFGKKLKEIIENEFIK